MEEQEDNQEEENQIAEERFYSLVSDFIARYEKPIGQAIEVYAKNAEKEPTRRLWQVFAVLVLVGLIVGIVGFLRYVNSVSGDAFAFLIGSIIGSLFGFLLKLVPSRPGS